MNKNTIENIPIYTMIFRTPIESTTNKTCRIIYKSTIRNRTPCTLTISIQCTPTVCSIIHKTTIRNNTITSNPIDSTTKTICIVAYKTTIRNRTAITRSPVDSSSIITFTIHKNYILQYNIIKVNIKYSCLIISINCKTITVDSNFFINSYSILIT